MSGNTSSAAYPYRVFIAYSHDPRDAALASGLASYLTERGFVNMWDGSIKPATRFPEEIKARIRCSHVFVPLLTPRSVTRPWVHQETGYAIGVDVPVFPFRLESCRVRGSKI